RVKLVAGALEEEVRLGEAPVEEAEIQALGTGGKTGVGAHGFLEMKLGSIALLVRQEEREVLNVERFEQAVADGSEHGVEVGFGAKLTGKLDQGASVIILVAVEDPVEPLLDPGADGLEEK